MPKYNNQTNRFQGGEFLKIPPDTTGMESIYYYDDTAKDFSIVDEAPYYNPVKFKQVIVFSSANEYVIDIPFNQIGTDSHLFVQTQCDNRSYDKIELYFNSLANLPALPLTNSDFNMINANRIKKLIFKTKENCTGEILVMIVDKHIPAITNIQEGENFNK